MTQRRRQKGKQIDGKMDRRLHGQADINVNTDWQSDGYFELNNLETVFLFTSSAVFLSGLAYQQNDFQNRRCRRRRRRFRRRRGHAQDRLCRQPAPIHGWVTDPEQEGLLLGPARKTPL